MASLCFSTQASPYPLILSLENHCSVEQQAVMAKNLRTILGNKLLIKPLGSQLKDLPSPEVRHTHSRIVSDKPICFSNFPNDLGFRN